LQILDVSREATQQQIQKAYRKLSLQYHPDKHPGDAKAAQKFEDVKTAYEVLSDPEKRQTYDLDGEEGLEQANQPQMDDPFAAFFGGGGGRRAGKQRGPNMGSEAEVTLDELYNGAQRKIRLQKNVICPKCRGTGAKDGAVKKCHACNGKGTRLTMQQMMPGFNVQMQTTCDVCGGKGTTAAQKCKHCNGNKVIREDKSLDLIIERGMPDGHEVVFEKEGEQAPNVIPGDVVIKLRTRPHNVFKRRGDDLLMEVQVTLKEALLGFKRRVIHLDHVRKSELMSDVELANLLICVLFFFQLFSTWSSWSATRCCSTIT
jgi:DnaJ-class molecular chaperone